MTTMPFSSSFPTDQGPQRSTRKRRLFGKRTLDAARAAILAQAGPQASLDDFLRASLRWLGLDIDMLTTDLERVPARGPLLVTANHPTGAMEGLLLLALLRTVRQDIKVIANDAVRVDVPEIDELLLPVDSDGSDAAGNAQSMLRAARWLQDGGCVLAFPAGSVATPRRPFGPVRERKWLAAIAGLQRIAGATTLPVWVHARTPAWFRIASSLHHGLRTLLLPRVLLAQCANGVAVRIGHPIQNSQLERFAADDDRARYMRLRCEILERRKQEVGAKPVDAVRRPSRAQEPLIDANAPELIERDLAALPQGAELLRQGSIRVLCARANDLPNVLRELGRLRELTFRGVGEGTGLSCDLDSYDQDYWHLFLWDESARAIIGAYRLGTIEELLAERGPEALYTTSLYRFRAPFFDHVRNGVELGRSFVQPAYQKGFLPLLLLWKGIAAFVVRDPRRRHLFGTVSISADHHATSVRLMVDHLRAHCFHPQLAESVRPVNPWRRPRSEKCGPTWDADHIKDLKDVSAMVREIEVVRQGVPVLLEQYLKLGADVVGINVDAAFHTIDALVVVDLAKSPLHLLERYMGSVEAKALKVRFPLADGEVVATA